MTKAVRQRLEHWRLGDLLRAQPGLRLAPAVNGDVRLVGTLAIDAAAAGKERIEDTYCVEILIPEGFPAKLPSVREIGGRIPKHFHTLTDGALCLGSPTRQLLAILDSPTLPAFMERCVVPYLYGYSFHEKHGTVPFGELGHGLEGIREDFAALFGVKSGAAADEFVRLASLKKRAANKYPCPCGSNRRLGKCHHRQVNQLRSRLGRSWFRAVSVVVHAALSEAPERMSEESLEPTVFCDALMQSCPVIGSLIARSLDAASAPGVARLYIILAADSTGNSNLKKVRAS